MTTPEAILVVGLLSASFWAWAQVLRRLRRGEEPVPYEPRRPVPWPGAATLVVALLYLLLQGAAAGLVHGRHQAGDGDAVEDPFQLLHVLQGHAVACVLVLFISPLVLKAFAPETRLADMGFDFSRPADDVRLGVVAFFAVVPPVLLVQVLVSLVFGESKHPLVEGWKQGGGRELLVWSIVGAVVAAPVVEEFLFRGVLQGWFERLFAPSGESQAAMPPDETAAAAVAETSAPQSSSAAIVVGSILFALAHLGNGPDPIPIFFLALGLGYLYRQTHRLLPGIVVHLLLNALSTAVLVLGIDR
jgi:membrane protease YdiL (CAAX protease family)